MDRVGRVDAAAVVGTFDGVVVEEVVRSGGDDGDVAFLYRVRTC